MATKRRERINTLAGLPVTAPIVMEGYSVVGVNKTYKRVAEVAGEIVLDEAFFGCVAANLGKPIVGYFPGGATLQLNGVDHPAYNFVSLADIEAGNLKLILDAANQQVSHYASTEVVVGAFPGPDAAKFSSPVTLGYNKGEANDIVNEVYSNISVAVPMGQRVTIPRASIGLITDLAAAAPITGVSKVGNNSAFKAYINNVLIADYQTVPVASFLEGDLEIENVTLDASGLPANLSLNFLGAYTLVLTITIYPATLPEDYVPLEPVDPPPTGGGGEGEVDEGDVVNPEAVPGYWNVISDDAGGLKSRNVHTGTIFEGTHDGFNAMLQEAGLTPTIKARR